jgi:hypothetical protein
MKITSRTQQAYELFDQGYTPTSPEVKKIGLSYPSRVSAYYDWEKGKKGSSHIFLPEPEPKLDVVEETSKLIDSIKNMMMTQNALNLASKVSGGEGHIIEAFKEIFDKFLKEFSFVNQTTAKQAEYHVLLTSREIELKILEYRALEKRNNFEMWNDIINGFKSAIKESAVTVTCPSCGTIFNCTGKPKP